MLDATSKIPVGVFMGNIADFGNLDECLEINANTEVGFVKGKHCISTLDLDIIDIVSSG